MLPLFLVLSCLGQLTAAGQDSETPLLQITVPRKIKTKDANATETHVTYMVRIENKTYTLHLERQSFLHPRFMAYSYSKSGILQTDYSLIKSHCFYQGQAEEIPSTVTVSTCSGLRGLLQLENITYGIEPLESSATFEHIFYEIKNNKIDYSPLKENYFTSQQESRSYRILVKPEKGVNVSLVTKTLRVKIVVDKAMFDHMGSEMGVATQKVVHIFGLINTMFSQLKVTILLSTLEIWSDKNKIETNGDADEVLQRFLLWKKTSPQRGKDITYLLLYKEHPDYMGATYHGIACNPNFTAGIALHPKTLSVEGFAVVLSQLLGINLGLTYDDVYNCFCPGSTCIMNPAAIRSHGIKVFSTCSIEALKQLALQPQLDCLKIKSGPKAVAQSNTAATCGNGILETPEECDCGSPEYCSHKKCCNPEDCTLISSSQCGTGKCCDKRSCKIAERGRLCRKSKDLCDFPEFCNGLSEHCVPDMKAADLEHCSNKTSFCYRGVCRDLDRQCTTIFGKYSKGSNYLCLQEVNVQNDKFGNCHGRCNISDLLCGKLSCYWGRTELVKTTKYDLQYTYLSGQVCVSAHLRDQNEVDDTYVHDGTVCGDGEVCIGGKCLRVHAIKRTDQCDSGEKCQGHGRCNTKHNCHCDPGFAPPECDLTPSSPGGSLDDGFWLPVDRSTPLVVKQPGTTLKKRLLISFYVLLPFLMMIAITVLKQNMAKKFWLREEAASEVSITESSKGSNQSKSRR